MTVSILDRIRIVLVGTTHPGNIGAAARAMKTMGLKQLALVAPARFPCAEATARASGADDVLAGACMHDDLAGALQDVDLAIATTARERYIEWPIYSPRSFAQHCAGAAGDGPIAVVFGRENSGLSNAELLLCDGVIRIPTDAGYSSLNLAMAVQIIAYEFCVLAQAGSAPAADAPVAADPAANWHEATRLHQHVLEVMQLVGYFNPAHPKLLGRRVRRLLAGSRLRHSEAQIIRGFLTAIQNRIARR